MKSIIVLITTAVSCFAQEGNHWQRFVAKPDSANFYNCMADIAGLRKNSGEESIVKVVAGLEVDFLALVEKGNSKAMELCVNLYPIFERPVYRASDLENFDVALGLSVRVNPTTFLLLACKYDTLMSGEALKTILGSTPESLVDNFRAQGREQTAGLQAIESVPDKICPKLKQEAIDILKSNIRELSSLDSLSN